MRKLQQQPQPTQDGQYPTVMPGTTQHRYGPNGTPAVDSPASRAIQKYAPNAAPSGQSNPTSAEPVDLDRSRLRLNKALQNQDYEVISEESANLRRMLETVKQQSEDESVPTQEKLEMKSKIDDAEDALKELEEGSRRRQDSKIRNGIIKIENFGKSLIPFRKSKPKE